MIYCHLNNNKCHPVLQNLKKKKLIKQKSTIFFPTLH